MIGGYCDVTLRQILIESDQQWINSDGQLILIIHLGEMAAKFCSGLRLFVRSTTGNYREIRLFDRPYVPKFINSSSRRFSSSVQPITLKLTGLLLSGESRCFAQLNRLTPALATSQVPVRLFCSTGFTKQQNKDDNEKRRKDEEEMEQKRLKTIKNTKLSLFLLGVSLTSLGLFLVLYYGKSERSLVFSTSF